MSGVGQLSSTAFDCKRFCLTSIRACSCSLGWMFSRVKTSEELKSLLEIPQCYGLKMHRYRLLFCSLLILGTSYAAADTTSITPLPSSPSQFPTAASITSQSSAKSTSDPKSLLAPGPDTTSPPDPSLPQENQDSNLCSLP
uniref:Uncharacterized protein n=1 Tax=Sphaerodactylus townsendi TaxID=933632 RepID=A0ACB8EV21_9SAUR